MSGQDAEVARESPDAAGRPALREVSRANTSAPYDEPILQEILETVQRLAEASMWAAPIHDAMVSDEDIAQDTAATLLQRGHPETVTSLTAWAIGIAKFKIREAARCARKRVPHVPLADDLHGPGTEEAVVAVTHYVWLLDQIAPMDRMIVEWRQAGFSSREVAQELQRIGYPHMTANNVDQRFFRALKTLRSRIFQDEESEDRESGDAIAAPERIGPQ